MLRVVTGYAYIPGHPRKADEYEALGMKLRECDIPLQFVLGDPRRTWLDLYLKWGGLKPTHSVSDNPKKNSLMYHCVQHEKIEWLMEAALRDPDADVFAWIDYGIFSVPGITVAVIEEWARKAENEQAIAIPGCWDKADTIDDAHPCWRFCGGVFTVPRKFLIPMAVALKESVMWHIDSTNNVSWEVNTFARMEQETDLPFWWYKADHDASIFTAYPETRHAC